MLLDDAAGIPKAEVIAFDANTRVGSAEHAAEETARIVRTYPAELVDKKIDSTLRGHVGAEVAAALAAYRALRHPDAIAVIAPAFPAMGRTTKGGRQYVHGVAIENGDLKRLFVDAVICDAETDEDLQAVAQRWLADPRGVLWVGSAGLMSAVTQCLPKTGRRPPDLPKADGPIIFAIGSLSQRSREQVSALRTVQQGRDVVLVGEPQALASEIAQRRDHIGGLVLTGGETARAVLTALGVTALRIAGEVETGVPISISEGLLRLPVITKAGDFGNRDTLVKCRAALQAK